MPTPLPTAIVAAHATEPSSVILRRVAIAISTHCPAVDADAFFDKFFVTFGDMSQREMSIFAESMTTGMVVGRVGSHRNPGNTKRVAQVLAIPR